MPKSQVMRIGLIVISALIIIGVSLMSWMLATEDDRNAIVVDVSDGKSDTIEFNSLCLLPGEQCEYAIALKSDNSDRYNLTFDFVELEEKTLKNFARVKIIANGEVAYDELLATAFVQNDIILPVDFNNEKNTELKIVYYMPIEVGNEAKNAEALFNLVLTASNE